MIQEEYRPSVYSQRNRYMVEHSGRVIAVYDEREKGGTVKTIRFAHRFRKELREIPVGLNLDKNRINLGQNRSCRASAINTSATSSETSINRSCVYQ